MLLLVSAVAPARPPKPLERSKAAEAAFLVAFHLPGWFVPENGQLRSSVFIPASLLLHLLSSARYSTPSFCSWEAVLECQPAFLGLFARQADFP